MISLFALTMLICAGVPGNERCGEISPPQTYVSIEACEAIAPDVSKWVLASIETRPAKLISWTCGPAPGRDL